MNEFKIKFGKIFWPSLIAALIVSIVGSIIFIVMISGVIGGLSEIESQPLDIQDKTVLHLTLENEIAESGSTKFDKSSFQISNKVGLSDLIKGFDEAEKDKHIQGIFLEISDLQCGYTTAKSIRNALVKFKKSGKFVIAYTSGEVVTQKEYYISSAATKVYGFPYSAMEFVGLGTELMYFKNTLEKLEVEMQVIRGKNNDFKSAVEPFFRENMSDSSRVQIQRYITNIWSVIRADISKDRKVSAEELNTLAENVSIKRCDDAVRYKLLDATKYRDEVIDEINKKLGNKASDEVHFVKFEKYAKTKFYNDQIIAKSSNPTVAVIVAEGEITTGSSALTSKEICKLFQDVRKEKSIKTVVFRINSPGGSALASDEIWREVKLTNKVKKVIVSMGDVAASGGYYIAAPATTIFAESTTVTGSIGVFGVIPYTGKMLENKLGLTFDRAGTNSHAVMSTNKKLTESETAMIQEEVDAIYSNFLSRVAEGRKMTTQQVNVIARGRVWTGSDAIKIGLVDKIGGLQEAIAYAAKEAKIKDPKILFYPNVEKDKLTEILEMLDESEDDKSAQSSTKLSDDLLKSYQKIKNLERMTGIQMRLPFEIDIR